MLVPKPKRVHHTCKKCYKRIHLLLMVEFKCYKLCASVFIIVFRVKQYCVAGSTERCCFLKKKERQQKST